MDIKEVNFNEDEIRHITSLQDDIKSKKKQLDDYVKSVQTAHNLDKVELCILRYSAAVEVDKETRKFLEPRKYKLKEYARLAYVSWIPNTWLDKFRIQFNSVSSNNKKGNEISLYNIYHISYEIVPNGDIDEARKMLTEIKKSLKETN